MPARSSTSANFDGFGAHLDNNKWRSGYVVGAGLEYGFASNWIVGVEYNYMDFGTQGSSGDRINGAGVVSRTSNASTTSSRCRRLRLA